MTFELPSGLPEGPWRAERDEQTDSTWLVVNRFHCVQEEIQDEKMAIAIASIPPMVEEIGRLEDLLNRQTARTEEEAELYGNALNDLEGLRALNAELLSSAEQFLRKLEFLCECAEGSGCKDAARRGALRDLIARAETAL